MSFCGWAFFHHWRQRPGGFLWRLGSSGEARDERERTERERTGYLKSQPRHLRKSNFEGWIQLEVQFFKPFLGVKLVRLKSYFGGTKPTKNWLLPPRKGESWTQGWYPPKLAPLILVKLNFLWNMEGNQKIHSQEGKTNTNLFLGRMFFLKTNRTVWGGRIFLKKICTGDDSCNVLIIRVEELPTCPPQFTGGMVLSQLWPNSQ